MNIIKSFMKWAIVNAIISFIFVYVIHHKDSDLKKNAANLDQDGIHVACRSQLEGKIHGMACSLCRSKWSDLKPSKSNCSLLWMKLIGSSFIFWLMLFLEV